MFRLIEIICYDDETRITFEIEQRKKLLIQISDKSKLNKGEITSTLRKNAIAIYLKTAGIY